MHFLRCFGSELFIVHSFHLCMTCIHFFYDPGVYFSILFRIWVKNVILYTCSHFLRVVYGHMCAYNVYIRIQYIKLCYPSLGIMILSKTDHALYVFSTRY